MSVFSLHHLPSPLQRIEGRGACATLFSDSSFSGHYLLFTVGLGRKKGPPQKIMEAPQRKKEALQRGKNYFPSIPTIPTVNFVYSEGLMDQKYV